MRRGSHRPPAERPLHRPHRRQPGPILRCLDRDEIQATAPITSWTDPGQPLPSSPGPASRTWWSAQIALPQRPKTPDHPKTAPQPLATPSLTQPDRHPARPGIAPNPAGDAPRTDSPEPWDTILDPDRTVPGPAWKTANKAARPSVGFLPSSGPPAAGPGGVDPRFLYDSRDPLARVRPDQFARHYRFLADVRRADITQLQRTLRQRKVRTRSRTKQTLSDTDSRDIARQIQRLRSIDARWMARQKHAAAVREVLSEERTKVALGRKRPYLYSRTKLINLSRARLLAARHHASSPRDSRDPSSAPTSVPDQAGTTAPRRRERADKSQRLRFVYGRRPVIPILEP